MRFALDGAHVLLRLRVSYPSVSSGSCSVFGAFSVRWEVEIVAGDKQPKEVLPNYQGG